CVGVDYFPCTVSSQCASGSTCSSGSGGISILSFDYYLINRDTQQAELYNSTSPLYILNSTNMYYKKFGTGVPAIDLTNNIVVDKLVGYSDRTKDYVYYLIPYNINDALGISGLYDSTRKQIIPGYYT